MTLWFSFPCVWEIYVGAYDVCTCSSMCTHVYMCMSMWRSVVDIGYLFDHPILHFPNQSHSLIIEHSNLLRLAGQWASGTILSWPQRLWLQMCAAAHGFSMDAEGLNSGPHACTVEVTLLHKPSFWQFVLHLWCEKWRWLSCHVHIDHLDSFGCLFILCLVMANNRMEEENLADSLRKFQGGEGLAVGIAPTVAIGVCGCCISHPAQPKRETELQLEAMITLKAHFQWPTASSKSLPPKYAATSPNRATIGGPSAYTHTSVENIFKSKPWQYFLLSFRLIVNLEVFSTISTSGPLPEDMW